MVHAMFCLLHDNSVWAPAETLTADHSHVSILSHSWLWKPAAANMSHSRVLANPACRYASVLCRQCHYSWDQKTEERNYQLLAKSPLWWRTGMMTSLPERQPSTLLRLQCVCTCVQCLQWYRNIFIKRWVYMDYVHVSMNNINMTSIASTFVYVLSVFSDESVKSWKNMTLICYVEWKNFALRHSLVKRVTAQQRWTMSGQCPENCHML